MRCDADLSTIRGIEREGKTEHRPLGVAGRADGELTFSGHLSVVVVRSTTQYVVLASSSRGPFSC